MNSYEKMQNEYLKFKTVNGIIGKQQRLKRWGALFLLYCHYCVLRRQQYCFWYINLYDFLLEEKSKSSESLKISKKEHFRINEKIDYLNKKLEMYKKEIETFCKDTETRDEQLKQKYDNFCLDCKEEVVLLKEKICNYDPKKMEDLIKMLPSSASEVRVTEKKKDKIFKVGVFDLFMSQYTESDYCSYDLVTRYMAIRDRCNFGAEIKDSIYDRMQIKSCGLSWSDRFEHLIDSVNADGLSSNTLITVNENMIITDGAHRLMLAMYKGLDMVSVKMIDKEFKRPWTMHWFWQNGFSHEECQLIKEEWFQIANTAKYPFYVTIFSPASLLFEQITEDIQNYDCDNISIISYKDYAYSEWQLRGLMKGMYFEDVISDKDLNAKVDNIIKATPGGVNLYPMRIVKVDVKNPKFAVRKENGFPQSMALKNMKMALRGRYKNQIINYKYDVIIHSSDNYIQSKMMRILIEMDTNLEEIFSRVSSIPYVAVKYDEAKQAGDFPKSFFIGSEVDIVIDLNDLKDFTEIVGNYLTENYQDVFSVSVQNREKNELVILKYGDFDVFTFHLQTVEYFGLKHEFNKEILDNRVSNGKIWHLKRKYELLIRLAEIVNKPSKYWHDNYIKKYSLEIDEKLFEKAYPNDSDLKHKVLEYISNLRGYNRYVKGDLSK